MPKLSTLITAASVFLTTTVDARPSSFISDNSRHVVTLTNANVGTIMNRDALTTDGLATKCVITDTSGTKVGGNYVIGTAYTFTVDTAETGGMGMVTSHGEGTADNTWAQDGTTGRVDEKVVSFTPTTAGDMSIHALCTGGGSTSSTGLYLATPLTGTIVAAACTGVDTPHAGCTVPACTAVDTPYAGCTLAACTAVDTPYVGCTVPACTAVDTPYAGCTLAACTGVDTPYVGCTVPACTAVDTPYAGCTKAPAPAPAKVTAPAPSEGDASAGQSLLISSVMIAILGMVMGVFASL